MIPFNPLNRIQHEGLDQASSNAPKSMRIPLPNSSEINAISQRSLSPSVGLDDPLNKLSSSQKFNKSKYNFNTDSHQVHFSDRAILYGSERAELIHTVPKIIHQYDCKLTYLAEQRKMLEKEFATSPLGEESYSLYKQELNQIDKEIELYKSYKSKAEKHLSNEEDPSRTWLTSQFFDEKLARDIDDYESRVSDYFPGGPINLNYHSFLGAISGRFVGLARCGAIADFSHPLISLSELREIGKKSLTEREKILRESTDIRDSSRKSPKQFIDYIRTPILDDLIIKREIGLNEQMLQLIETQIDKNPLQFDQPLRLFHLGLMNENNSDGKTFHEGKIIGDMADTFERFNGKTLIFDGTGPYIDKEGKIHLSKNLGGKSVVLETFFANVSVQGSLKKQDLQNQMNQQTLDRFLEIAPDEKKGEILNLKQKLASGSSSSSLARDFLRIALDSGVISSTGCRKGKDRTGLVCGLVARSYLNEEIDKTGLKSAKSKELKNRFAESLLSEDSVASWVVWNNTRIVVLKVTAFVISGVSYFKRLHYYLKQTGLVIDMAKIGIKRKIQQLPSYDKKNITEIFQRTKTLFTTSVEPLLKRTSTRIARIFNRIKTSSLNFFQRLKP